MSAHPPQRLARLSLLQRAALANAAVLVLAFVLLALSPVTISAPIRLGELAILGAGLVAMLTVNLILVRRALAPLEELAEGMKGIDLRDPEPQLETSQAESAELAAFTRALNTMVDRLAEERRMGARAALSAQEAERLRIASWALKAARAPMRRSSARRSTMVLRARVKAASSALSACGVSSCGSGSRRSIPFIPSASSSSGAKARRTKIKLTVSIATRPAPRMASSPRRIGALMVTGLSASNTKAKTSTAAFAKAAR